MPIHVSGMRATLNFMFIFEVSCDFLLCVPVLLVTKLFLKGINIQLGFVISVKVVFLMTSHFYAPIEQGNSFVTVCIHLLLLHSNFRDGAHSLY